MAYYVQNILQALDNLSGGRCIAEKERWSAIKSSDIQGKSITEMPGLVWGNPSMEVKKIALMMTLTESAIELAAATGVNVIVAHHPIADAANFGGALLKLYLDLYGIAVFELHEAFHGLHPGIPFLHGHKPNPAYTRLEYGGIPGNIVYIGEPLPKVNTVGDILDRLNDFMDIKASERLLKFEQNIRGCNNIQETRVAVQGKILVGEHDNSIKKIIHMFPHTGFNASHLESLLKEHPDADTLLATISRVYPGHELIAKAEEYGLNFVCGNSHAMEIYENGLPLAYALRQHLPQADVVIFCERVTSTPLDEFGTVAVRGYAEHIVTEHLSKSKKSFTMKC